MSEELKTYDFPVDHGDFTTTIELFYLKSEADKVIKELMMRLHHSMPRRTCRKCGREGTLMLMPLIDNNTRYWKLYNNKGIDYVFCIKCAHCGEVAFVTKQTHEYELRHQKYKRCLAMAKWCEIGAQFQHDIAMRFDNPFYIKRAEWLEKWHKRWLELAEVFK